MKSQILKPFMLTFIVGVALILTNATQSNAQSGPTIKIKIPFDYTAGNKNLSAGKYSIGRIFEGVFVIRSEDGKFAGLVTALCGVQSRSNSQPKLVFNRYGDEYFLSQIWLDSSTGSQMHKSKAERRADANTRLAKNNAKPQVVEVIVKIE